MHCRKLWTAGPRGRGLLSELPLVLVSPPLTGPEVRRANLIASASQARRRSAPARRKEGLWRRPESPQGANARSPSPSDLWLGAFLQAIRELGLVPEEQRTPWAFLLLSEPPESLTSQLKDRQACGISVSLMPLPRREVSEGAGATCS